MNRRHLLSGLLAALPPLSALTSGRARGQPRTALRFVAIFAPNGVVPSLWKPVGWGMTTTLSSVLQPLKSVLNQTSIVSNTRLGASDNMGSHGGGQKCFLTASDTLSGATSLDQALGQLTQTAVRLPTLNLSIENNGYYWPPQIVPNSSGVYQAPNGEDRQDRCQDAESCRVSVADGTTQGNLYHPQVVFERLFGAMASAPGTPGPAVGVLKEAARRRRVVDLLKVQAQHLQAFLGTDDRRRLEEYLSGVRAIERELDALSAPVSGPSSSNTCDKMSSASGIPVDRDAYVGVLSELIVRAFQCDATRAVTLMLGQGVSPMNFVLNGQTFSHHGTSHHGNDPVRRAAKGAIDTWQVGVFARLVNRLAETHDADGLPLIDRSLVFYGSDIADSDLHNAVDMPMLLGGRLGGAFRPGGHVNGNNQTAGDLFVRVHQAFGSSSSRFGKFGTKPMEGV